MTDKELEAFRQYRSKLGVCLVPRDGVGGISCHESSGVCACYTDVLLTYAESLRAKLGEAEDRWKRYSDADTKAKIIARSIDVEEAYRVISKRAESAESKLAERDAEIATLKSAFAAQLANTEKTMKDRRAAESRLSVAVEALKAGADSAYCDYIAVSRTTECLGWEAKVKSGQFGTPELAAHERAAELLGTHRGLMQAVAALSKLNSPRVGEETSEVVKLRESLRRAVKALEDGKYPIEQLRLWVVANFPDGTIRGDYEVPRSLYCGLERWHRGALDSLNTPTPPNPGEKEREAGA